VKTLYHLALASIVGVAAVGCEKGATTDKKVEVTEKTPGGTSTTTVEQKTDKTPTSETTTTTEKVEKSGENPPPAVKP
jgi:hypothetical protein